VESLLREADHSPVMTFCAVTEPGSTASTAARTKKDRLATKYINRFVDIKRFLESDWLSIRKTPLAEICGKKNPKGLGTISR
jgi:hypothetical protein